MSYYNLISDISQYFKSIRFIKNYISFDLYLPTNWIVVRSQKVEIVESETEKRKVTSFVVPFQEELVDELEKVMKETIRKNLENEEKKRLFDKKVEELKDLFKNQKLDDLKNIEFQSKTNLKFEDLEDVEESNT